MLEDGRNSRGFGELCTVSCAGQPISGKKEMEKKEAQRIKTEIIMGLKNSSVMADAKLKKEANKIIEMAPVHS